MEIIRYGARKGGQRIGCCAVDLFQGFDVELNKPMVSPVKYGDTEVQVGDQWRGPTALDIFKQGLAFGTFSDRPMVDRCYFAILSQGSMESIIGLEWLEELYKHGFKFLVTINNSVYDDQDEDFDEPDPSPVHIFYLARNVGFNKVDDPFTPPEVWQALANKATTQIDWADEWEDFKNAHTSFAASDEQKQWWEDIGSREKW
jgi:hypothetical protein